MKRIWIFTLLMAMVSVSPAAAQYYRYTDRHGNVIYADSLENVPVDRRPHARLIDDNGRAAHLGAPENSAGLQPTVEERSLLLERAELDVLKKKLEEEFKVLVHENARLKEEQKAAVTPDQRRAVNKKVIQYNTRFQAYREKEAAFKTRLEDYKKRISRHNPKN